MMISCRWVWERIHHVRIFSHRINNHYSGTGFHIRRHHSHTKKLVWRCFVVSGIPAIGAGGVAAAWWPSIVDAGSAAGAIGSAPLVAHRAIAVPEPSTIAILALFVIITLAIRRRDQ